jgi:PHP family Zn ribbon phosphoesterase
MEQVRVDWHIHTTLSPCGSLLMDPLTILQKAQEMDLQVIGITDHNSTRQGRRIKSDFPESSLMILTGAEVTTREEIHCLAFFDDNIALDEFQTYLDFHLPFIPNDTDYFGDQVVVNSKGRIVYQENRLLISALDQSLEEVAEFVTSRGGIFIPAHINRPCFSLLSQIGFIPDNLKADALEWVPGGKLASEFSDVAGISTFPVVYSSDAHVPEAIGTRYTLLEISERSFIGIKKGIAGIINADT